MCACLGLSCSVLHSRSPKATVFNSFSCFFWCLCPHFLMMCAYGTFIGQFYTSLRLLILVDETQPRECSLTAQPDVVTSTHFYSHFSGLGSLAGAPSTPGPRALRALVRTDWSICLSGIHQPAPFPMPTGVVRRQAASHKHLRQTMFK